MTHLSARRIALLVLLFGTAAAVAVLAGPASILIDSEWTQWRDRPRPIVADEKETAAILRAVIEANGADYGLPPPPPPPPPPGLAKEWEPPSPAASRGPRPPLELILLDQSADICPPPRSSADSMPCDFFSPGAMMDSALVTIAVSLKLRQELQLANRNVASIPDPGLPTVHRVAASVVDALFKTGGWKEFYERYPGTAGTLQASLPVLTEDRSQALIYVDQSCEGNCGTGFVHLLRRTENGWTQIGRWMLWIS